MSDELDDITELQRRYGLDFSFGDLILKVLDYGDRIEKLEDALAKVVSDSSVGVVPKSHIQKIEQLLGEG